MDPIRSGTWRDMRLSLKLPLSIFIIVSLVFAAFVLVVSHLLARSVEARAEREIADKLHIVVSLLEAADRDFRARTPALAQAFLQQLAGR
ncbi:MAG: hypothetical protein ACK4MJ_03645, partial [Hylemonella sp.]